MNEASSPLPWSSLAGFSKTAAPLYVIPHSSVLLLLLLFLLLFLFFLTFFLFYVRHPCKHWKQIMNTRLLFFSHCEAWWTCKSYVCLVCATRWVRSIHLWNQHCRQSHKHTHHLPKFPPTFFLLLLLTIMFVVRMFNTRSPLLANFKCTMQRS